MWVGSVLMGNASSQNGSDVSYVAESVKDSRKRQLHMQSMGPWNTGPFRELVQVKPLQGTSREVQELGWRGRHG